MLLATPLSRVAPVIIAAGVLLASPVKVRATDEKSINPRLITDLIPAQNLVVYTAKPYRLLTQDENGQDQSGTASISQIVAFLNASGLIPDEGQVFADIAASLPLLGQFEHALVLLDVSSKVVRRPGQEHVSLRLKHLESAVLFRTGGEYRAVLQQLNRIVRRYTNREVAKLTTKTIGDIEFQRLEDERLPGWAVWEWGRIDDFYVVCFGDGAFEKIAATARGEASALCGDSWFRNASQTSQVKRQLAQWFIGFELLEKRLGEVAQGRHERVIRKLGADKLTHDLWTVGLDDRALSWVRHFRRDGKDETVHYSDPALYQPRHKRIVPDAARHYAVIKVPTSWLVDNLPKAWIAGRSQRHVREWERIWESLEAQSGIDLSGNLANNLGDHVVIFDYPTHPLKIPFALTVAIEIKDQKPVKMASDALLEAWGRHLDERAKRKGTTLARVRVLKAHDDIWYLKAAILGPAMKVTPRYVVFSWSPKALREALPFIESKTPTAPHRPERPPNPRGGAENR